MASASTGDTYEPTMEQFLSLWPAVLEALKSYSKVAWMSFSSSRPISWSDGDLAVAVRDAGTVKGVKASGHDERLRQAVLDVVRTNVRIDVVFAPDQAGALPTPAPAREESGESAAPEHAVATSVEPDAPSLDDADLDDASGVDLAIRELGATQIGEIEH